MRLKDNYSIRKIAGRDVLVPRRVDGRVATVILSSSAAWLWETLRNRDFTEEDATDYLMSRYDVSCDRARGDVRSFFDTLRGCDALED